jgi:hypothetical protein
VQAYLTDRPAAPPHVLEARAWIAVSCTLGGAGVSRCPPGPAQPVVSARTALAGALELTARPAHAAHRRGASGPPPPRP